LAAQRRTDDHEYERYLAQVAILAEDRITDLNNEVSEIRARLAPHVEKMDDPTQGWTAYPLLDWRGRRTVEAIQDLSEECIDAIDDVVEVISDYVKVAEAERKGDPISVDSDERPDWSEALDAEYQRLIKASDARPEYSLDHVRRMMHNFLVHCGSALESVRHGQSAVA
jgi:hypothetical protein